MATDTAEPTSLQTGTTPNPISSNAQDFSGSDDEIMDNFSEGPDDGVPMGVGGERGKQSEPVSSTLEADIANGTTKQSGEKLPPEDSAGEPEPIQEPSETDSETSPEPDESETPDLHEVQFPPALLQMAGLTDAAAAQAAGFDNPDALFAAIRWRSQLLTPGVQPTQPSEQGLYRRPSPQPTSPAQPAPESVAEPEDSADITPFQLPADKRDMLDEDLLEVLDKMNQHYQQELKSLRSSVGRRENDLARQQEQDEESRFDKAVQGLGGDWQDVFGEGNGMDLAKAGQRDPIAMTNFNHRALLFEAVEAVREINTRQGYKPMNLEQEVQWALMQRYPDKFQQIVSRGTNGSSGQRRGVTASRPTQRKTPPKGQNAKVLSDVNAMLKKKGRASLDLGQEDEFAGDI